MKRFLFMSLVILGICLSPAKIFAWSQDTHENINSIALNLFHDKTFSSKKYELSPIQETILFKGLKTVSASLQKKNYKDEVSYNTFDGWVIHGGYSADEPNVYAGVRHFYDPLYLSENLSGENVAYLTDQVSMHALSSLYETGEIPDVDAMEWAINHKDNPYSFEKAQEYYYRAMTISESESVTGFDAEDLFRIRDINAKSLEEQRSLYLAAAFRGLGETMHMLADMTVPAHVRNDGHVHYDPLEKRITGNEVQLYGMKPVNSEIRELFSKNNSESPLTLEEIFLELSTFTNQNFYSGDTIYDEGEKVYPNNGEENYPSPQFSMLTKSSVKLKDGREAKTWNGSFDGVQVPLASQSLINIVLQNDNSYLVSPSDALEQGKVLIPIAVAACTDLIDRFFPTLELAAEAGDEHEMSDKKGNGYTGIELDVNLLHYCDADIDWDDDMEIEYCGPGKLIFKEEGNIIRECKVHFEKGVISEIQVGKDMKDQTLMVYQKKSPKTKLSKEEAQYEITDKTTVKVIVDAGGRIILSEEITFDESELELEISFEPEKPLKVDEITFNTESTLEGYYVWDLGDGSTEEGYNRLTVKHRYEKEDDYEVNVTCYADDRREKVIAGGETEISVGEKFDIKILPSNNLEAKVKDRVEVSAVPAESNRSLTGFKLNWILENAAVVQPNEDKVQFQYNEAGRYSILVQALDVNEVVMGEGRATIEITDKEQKIKVTYPSEIGFLDAFDIVMEIDDASLRQQITGITLTPSDHELISFCNDKTTYMYLDSRFEYEGEERVIFYGNPRKFPEQDTPVGIDLVVRLSDNSRLNYQFDIMIRGVTYEITAPDSGQYDKASTNQVDLNRADEGGNHEGTSIPLQWFYHTDMSDQDGYAENFKAARMIVKYHQTSRDGEELKGKLDKSEAKEYLMMNESALNIPKLDHLEYAREDKYEQGELPDSFFDIKNVLYGFYAKSFDAFEVKKSYDNPVKTQAGEQVYTVRMVKEYYILIGEKLFCIYTNFVENAPASQVDAAFTRLEAQCDSAAASFRVQSQAQEELITIE